MKIKSFVLVASVLFLFSMTAISALDCSEYTWGCIKQGSCIDISTVCPLQGCNQTNITRISYPNSNLAVANVQATHNGVQWNYTFCNTTILGTYKVSGVSSNGTSNVLEPFSGDFEVTNSGDNIPENQGLTIYGLIAFTGLLVLIGFTFSQEKWKMRSFFFLMACIFGVITLNSVRIIASTSEHLGTMMSIALYSGIIILLVLFLYFFVYALIESLTYFKSKKNSKWGYRN